MELELGKIIIYTEFDWRHWTVGVAFDTMWSEVIFYLLPLRIVVGKSSTYK